MPKLSPNQEASLAGLRKATVERQVELVSRSVWRQHCADGVSVHAGAMVKAGAVVAVTTGVSVNGKLTELYKPA